jgi:Zn finger protein HypA/HybF involved in hydrogenase expression
MIKKIKCNECEKNAVILENKIYYCGDCAVEQFITKLHKRLQSKPVDSNKTLRKGS